MRQKISRKRREFLTRRAGILSAAEKVFAAKGFYGSTMDGIAKRAEFGTGSFYKYFQGNRDLYFSLIYEKVEEITRLVGAELGKDLPPSTGLHQSSIFNFPSSRRTGISLRFTIPSETVFNGP